MTILTLPSGVHHTMGERAWDICDDGADQIGKRRTQKQGEFAAPGHAAQGDEAARGREAPAHPGECRFEIFEWRAGDVIGQSRDAEIS